MPEIDINVINDLEEGLLTTYTRANIADYITHEACKTYYNLYNKVYIPSSFIKFFYNEYKNYVYFANNEIKKFFKLYKDEDIQMIVFNYKKDQFSLIDKQKTKNDDIYYHINVSNNLNINFADEYIYGYTNPELYKSLYRISNHIDNSDELLDKKELYQQYMMKEALKTDYRKSKPVKVVKNNTRPTNTANTTQSSSGGAAPKLMGKTIELPKQDGKVAKIFFPRLNLPTSYPTSQTVSKINVKVKLGKLSKTDQTIKLINQYKFNGVKYSQKFIDKRKAAFQPPKKKFNFDF